MVKIKIPSDVEIILKKKDHEPQDLGSSSSRSGSEKKLSLSEQGDSNVENSISDLQKYNTKDSVLNDAQSSGDASSKDTSMNDALSTGDSSTQIKENESYERMSSDKDLDKEKKDDILKIKVKHEFKGKFKRR